VPAWPARGPARGGAGRGPSVSGGAVRRPGRAPVAAPDLDGPAGSVRVVIDPGSDCTEICGLGPRPAGPMIFDIWLSAGAPETVTAGTLNAAEAWLAEPGAAMTPDTGPGALASIRPAAAASTEEP